MTTQAYSATDPARGRRRIGIVGSGISGASAAWALSKTDDVTLFEKSESPGGHTATVDIDYEGTPVSVDTGFIVYNELNYPNLTALFTELEVQTHASNMGFSLSLDGGKLEWSGQSYATLFAQKSNMFSLPFINMLREILRFNRQCIEDRDAGFTRDLSIGDYLQARKFTARFRDDYLIPMGAAIWSTPRIEMLAFPADAFINFFENHRLIHNERPDWRTVTGGSRNYLQKLLARPGIALRTSARVIGVSRSQEGVTLELANGKLETFDAAILAGHSDQTLEILDDANDLEKQVLSAIRYRPNRVILHRDPRLMPKRKAAWAAWNYLRNSSPEGEPEVAVTYWMNRLQGIDEKLPLFVTLNPPFEPRPELVFGQWSYDHPQFDAKALIAQKQLAHIQGRGHVFFAGAWTGYGFHEDGLRSGLEAARALGANLSRTVNPSPMAQLRPAAG